MTVAVGRGGIRCRTGRITAGGGCGGFRVLPAAVLGLSLALGALAPCPVSGQDTPGDRPASPELRFFDWTDLQFPTDEYRTRRRALLARLRARGGGVLLVPSAGGDSDGGTFRQLDDFNYLTGLELPESVLALDADEYRTILFVPDRDPRFEGRGRPNDYPGRPLRGDPDLGSRGGIGAVLSTTELDPVIAGWVAERRTVWVGLGRTGAVDSLPGGYFVDPGPLARFASYLRERHRAARLQNAFEEIARLRAVKSPAEIGALRRAAEATAVALAGSARFVVPGIDERTLEGQFEALCKRQGAQRVAFASIVKSGPNALRPWRVLAAHYDRRNRTLELGDVVIFDVGCELDHYVSDVGRTFPVSGAFTPRQREVVALVSRVSDAIIQGVRPGVTFADLQRLALDVIPEAERGHMQAPLFFGHHLGLSTGDPSLPDEPLAAGMVFTVEPWYYNHAEGIAAFMEDEVLVTVDGAEVLTSALPRSPEGLEALMKGLPGVPP